MSTDRREVLQDPVLGMVGAFRPLAKGARGKLDIQMAWGGATIQWRGPDQLGIGDQSVLLAVLEVARQQWCEEPAATLVTPDDALWSLLGHEKHVFVPELVRVTTSFRRLSMLCGGGDSGAELSQVRAALRRLTETTVWVRHGKLEGSSRLLGWQIGNESQVVLVLNWRLTQALQGISYARISISERLKLDSEPAKALHAVLSCKVDPGKGWSWTLEALQRYVWGNTLTEGASRRKRHARLREVLRDIQRVDGWTVTFEGEQVHVARCRAQKKLRHAQPASPVISLTPRKNGHETPEERTRPLRENSSNGAGFQLVDVSLLITQRRA